MRKKILLTGAGGYGSNALYKGFKNIYNLNNIEGVGTHHDKYMLARSPFNKNYLVTAARVDKEQYIQELTYIVKKEKIDLLIPRSDLEINILNNNRNKFKCKVFLPNKREISKTQDKLKFYHILYKKGVPIPITYQIKDINKIKDILGLIPKVKNRYWLRIKSPGYAGAYGATWVKNVNEVNDWLTKFSNTNYKEFTLSEYLPGKLYECIFLYYNGKLKICKIYENFRYINFGSAKNIGSTPEIAKSAKGEIALRAIKNSKKAIEAGCESAGTKPHGVYHLSAKLNSRGVPCITEVNIGRTPSTIEIFDSLGETKLSEHLLACALDLKIKSPRKIYDLESKNFYFIRSLDANLHKTDKINYEQYYI
tara:strand:+ start:2786 stop:3883 length:1098 start_codon:yes stop_codon:yes gene_type:complete